MTTLIDASKPPKLLVSGKLNAKQRMPIQRAPAVAMAVNSKLAEVANLLRAGKSNAVQRNHCAGPATANHLFVMPQHRVEFVADIEGVHHFLATAIGMRVDDAHDYIDTIVKR